MDIKLLDMQVWSLCWKYLFHFLGHYFCDPFHTKCAISRKPCNGYVTKKTAYIVYGWSQKTWPQSLPWPAFACLGAGFRVYVERSGGQYCSLHILGIWPLWCTTKASAECITEYSLFTIKFVVSICCTSLAAIPDRQATFVLFKLIVNQPSPQWSLFLRVSVVVIH